MSRQLLLPTPLSLLLSIHYPHSAPHLALQRLHARTLLLVLNIIPDHKRLALHPPLHHRILDPPNSLTRPTTSTSLRLILIARMPTARSKQLDRLIHPDVRRESRHLTLIHAWVHRRVVVLVLRKLSPEPAHDAVAGAWQVGRWALLALRNGVQAAKDEFRAVHAGDVIEEFGAPGRGVRGAGHCAVGLEGAREVRETEFGSYGCLGILVVQGSLVDD
jgi:hypothetical protein